MKKANDSPDKQKSRRKELGIPILITRIKADSRGKTFFGYAKNISRGGMFIQTINPKDVNDRFQVEFSLPGKDEPIRGKVEVVWKRRLLSRSPYEPGMGIRFLEIDEEKSMEIHEWVESRLKEGCPGQGGALNYA